VWGSWHWQVMVKGPTYLGLNFLQGRCISMSRVESQTFCPCWICPFGVWTLQTSAWVLHLHTALCRRGYDTLTLSEPMIDWWETTLGTVEAGSWVRTWRDWLQWWWQADKSACIRPSLGIGSKSSGGHAKRFFGSAQSPGSSSRLARSTEDGVRNYSLLRSNFHSKTYWNVPSLKRAYLS